ncbi:MAG: hypothetical protein AAB368_02115, partial [bacterium]
AELHACQAELAQAREEIALLRTDDILELDGRLAQAEAEAQRVRSEAPGGYNPEAHAQLRQRLSKLRATTEETGRAEHAQSNLVSVERQREKHAERERNLVEKYRTCAERDDRTLAQAREDVERRGRGVQEAKDRLARATAKRNYVRQAIKREHQELKAARSEVRSLVYVQKHYTPDTKGPEDDQEAPTEAEVEGEKPGPPLDA